MMTNPSRLRSILLLSSSALFGCRQGVSAVTSSHRSIHLVNWKVDWRSRVPIEGNPPAPLRLVPQGGKVYVVDPHNKALYALEASDGRMVWSRFGSHDSSIVLPHDVAVTHHHLVAVADLSTHALLMFDTAGQPRPAIQNMPPVYSFCAIGDSLLALTWTVDQPIWMVSATDGGVGSKADLPWDDTKHAMPDKTSGVFESNDQEDACVFVREKGDGFAVWHHGKFDAPHAFVEKGHTSLSGFFAASGSFVGDDVYVLFHGATGDSDRVLDVYDAQSGEYKRTLSTPARLIWVSYRGGEFYGIEPNGTEREVIAFSQHE